MTVSPISGIHDALYGIKKNLEHFDDTAERLTREASNGDLATGLVELKIAETGVAANARVVRATDETVGTLLEILR